MAETANLARMAEKLSDDLFGEFLWQKTGPTNQNWSCEQPELHDVKTHPSDVVFFYNEPYMTTRTYIQCDLKSYSTSSITKTAVKGALVSLAKQVSCAEISEQWQKMYTHNDCTPEICGLLFVYNHDGDFDKNFDTLLSDLKPKDIDIGSNSRLYVMGPDDINWLDRVAREIRQMRGSADTDARLPERSRCAFYYPQLIRKTNVQQIRAATLEMLTSPWIVLEHFDDDDARQGLVIFHRRPTSVEGLMYLIDYLRHYQLIQKKVRIDIKVPDADIDAKNNLQKAKQQYLFNITGNEADTDFARRIEKNILLSFIPNVIASYSTDVIGMEYAG